MKRCEHCGEPLSRWDCQYCVGTGKHYHSDGTIFAVDCSDCGGKGHTWECVNPGCPGRASYPATAEEAAMARGKQVQR